MNSFLTLALPAPLTPIAKLISRSLDPDVGGFAAFTMHATNEQGVTYAIYGFPCTAEFQAQAMAFKDTPAALHYAVTNDPRWQGETMPTLADVEAFCADVLMATAWGVESGACELGLVVIQE